MFLKCLPDTIVNPFPNIDTFWRFCSRWLFENIVTKEEIAQIKKFLPLPQCFPLLVIGYPFNYRGFLFFDKIISKSSAADFLYVGKGYQRLIIIYILCNEMDTIHMVFEPLLIEYYQHLTIIDKLCKTEDTIQCCWNTSFMTINNI